MSDSAPDIREIIPGLANASCPLEGVATAGQPTEEEIGRLAAAGYRTVLDLRAPDEPRGYEEEKAVRDAGMEYINLPVTPQTLDDASFDRFRELLRDPARRPIVVHCGSANRVGALLFPYLTLDEGRDPDEAFQMALDVGLRSQALADLASAYIQRIRGDDED
ncbi:MAG TPA: protein tyrosine phosphatase family protein [Longimicrobiales bacterium]